MMVGLVKPNEGHVYLDDEDITDQPMYRKSTNGNWLFGTRSFSL